MAYKDKAKLNAWWRKRTERLNAQGLTMRGTKKIRFTRPPCKPVSDEEIDRRMSQ